MVLPPGVGAPRPSAVLAASAALVLLVVATAAARPVAQAIRTDPSVVLRSE